MDKKKIGILVVAVAALAAIFYGCSTTGGGGGGGTDWSKYFPTATGNTWVYTSEAETAIVTAEGEYTTGEVTVTVFARTFTTTTTTSTTIGTSPPRGLAVPGENDELFKVTSDGVYFYIPGTLEALVPLKMVAFPIEIGKTWEAGSIMGGYTLIGNVSQESITVPAGTFNCYKTDLGIYSGSQEIASIFTWWLAENVGRVKIAMIDVPTFELYYKNF